MLPMQRKKVDISSLSPQEKMLFEKYGKLPTHKNVLSKVQKDRKYFDSGDYAMSKAGIQKPDAVGTAIPQPESIPHPSPSPAHNLASSPTGGTGAATGASPPNTDTPLRQHSEGQAESAPKQEEVKET